MSDVIFLQFVQSDCGRGYFEWEPVKAQREEEKMNMYSTLTKYIIKRS